MVKWSQGANQIPHNVHYTILYFWRTIIVCWDVCPPVIHFLKGGKLLFNAPIIGGLSSIYHNTLEREMFQGRSFFFIQGHYQQRENNLFLVHSFYFSKKFSNKWKVLSEPALLSEFMDGNKEGLTKTYMRWEFMK